MRRREYSLNFKSIPIYSMHISKLHREQLKKLKMKAINCKPKSSKLNINLSDIRFPIQTHS